MIKGEKKDLDSGNGAQKRSCSGGQRLKKFMIKNSKSPNCDFKLMTGLFFNR